jgi:hypothetical protein
MSYEHFHVALNFVDMTMVQCKEEYGILYED